MSISPKLSNSTPTSRESPHWAERHEAIRHAPEVVRRLMAEYDYQIKFVVDCPDDCREVEQYLTELPEVDRSRVMLMPQGVDARELADQCPLAGAVLRFGRAAILPASAHRVVRRAQGRVETRAFWNRSF